MGDWVALVGGLQYCMGEIGLSGVEAGAETALPILFMAAVKRGKAVRRPIYIFHMLCTECYVCNAKSDRAF